MVKIPIIVAIATSESLILIRNSSIPKKRIKQTEKLVTNDHRVKNLNCFPNPVFSKRSDPARKNMSAIKIDASKKQTPLNKSKEKGLGSVSFIIYRALKCYRFISYKLILTSFKINY